MLYWGGLSPHPFRALVLPLPIPPPRPPHSSPTLLLLILTRQRHNHLHRHRRRREPSLYQVVDPKNPVNELGDGAFVDQLLGQWWAHVLGLGYGTLRVGAGIWEGGHRA